MWSKYLSLNAGIIEGNFIDAIEYSQKNISYLKSQFNKLDKNWLKFWNYIVNLDFSNK